jgi:putative endonuclease
MGDPRRHLGRLGEQLAAEHVERLGLEVLDRNYRTRWGELDLVAWDPQARTLVFCEVKTRRRGGGAAFESMRAGKPAQVRRIAMSWLCESRSRPTADDLRFDAIGVTVGPTGRLEALEHLEGAF